MHSRSSMLMTNHTDIMIVVRKVFRQDDAFVCGLCRYTYETASEARDCLENCWDHLLQGSGTVRKRSPFSKHYYYRCRFCGRDYRLQKEAYVCAQECKAKIMEIIPVEQEINRTAQVFDVNGQAHNIKRKYPTAMATLAPKKAIQWKKNVGDDAPAANQVDDGSAKNALATDATITPAAAENPENKGGVDKKKVYRRKKSAFGEGWMRQGALYMCKVCNQEHWTRVEVLACFDGHFDEDGLEIINEE